MMGITDDRNDPRLGHGSDTGPVPMNDVYLVLSADERAKGFQRPYRETYVHVGRPGPKFPLRDLTHEERDRHGPGYVKYEEYPESESPKVGRAWTQTQLDSIGQGCGAVTQMGRAIAETYARDPGFYGSTYCVGCHMHRPVGVDGEFMWDGTGDRVGT